MPSHLCISVAFLDPYFHGRRDGGEPEWPPSPLRLFQALVAACAARQQLHQARAALEWLEHQPAPRIVAPPGKRTDGYVLSVPNNAMDLVARAWSKGNYYGTGDANPATHRTLRPVRPTRLVDGDAVHYIWKLPDPVSDDIRTHAQTLSTAARNMVALGWGIDLVAAYGRILSQEQAGNVSGESWLPTRTRDADGLRAPAPGTLDALVRRHQAFLNRLAGGRLNPPPPLTGFEMIGYRRATQPPPRPFVAFSLLKPDVAGFRAFDTVSRACAVAGMMRHVTRIAAGEAGWTEDRINAFVLGHGRHLSAAAGHVPVGPRRFAYLPLPSIEARGKGRVGSVRRVLLTAFSPDCADEITWARRALPGRFLRDDQARDQALLALIPNSEHMVHRYTRQACCWATVTPVILPGFDGRLHRKAESLLRKAIEHAGFPTVLARWAELEWSPAGFWPGCDLAGRYRVPSHLQHHPRLHVRIRWRDEKGQPIGIPGPICLGGGRFFGLGLFAADPEA